jgi:hypothetical protein
LRGRREKILPDHIPYCKRGLQQQVEMLRPLSFTSLEKKGLKVEPNERFVQISLTSS